MKRFTDWLFSPFMMGFACGLTFGIVLLAYYIMYERVVAAGYLP